MNVTTMLVIMEQIYEECTNNTVTFLLIFIMKAALDTIIFHVLCHKWRSSFLGLCSMSMVLFDWVMAGLLLTMWFVQADWSFGSPCFPFAFASMTCRALALPMIFFGFLDYWFNDSGIENKLISSRFQRNVTLALLVWLIAIFYPLNPWRSMMIEVHFEPGTVLFMCETEESMLIAYTDLGLFIATLLTIVSVWSKSRQWLRKINRTFELREKANKTCDFPCVKNHNSEETTLDDSNATRPPLWFNLTLGFAIVWMPYLSVSVGCMVLGIKTPAYISMNLFWVECVNNTLEGVVFWIKQSIYGTQNQLPEDVGSWQIYWHLSRDTNQQQPVEELVVNPTKEKNVDLLNV